MDENERRDGTVKPLVLGNEPSSRLAVHLSEKERSTHMHIIGATGTGKSKFIEHLVRQDIKEKRGVCLIDPTGELYFNIVRWLASWGFKRQVILFHPAVEDITLGFNPLKRLTSSFDAQRDSIVKAIAGVWGSEDMTRTPLLKRALKAIFHVLLEKQFTFLEAQYLITPHDPEVREFLTRGIQDYFISKEWEYFNDLKPRQYYEEFGSAVNRLAEFLSSSLIKRILGQDQATIDFKKIMDEGHILLVNLAPIKMFYGDDEPMEPAFSFDNARLLGSLISNNLFEMCRLRPKGSRPFYAYIDEFGLFVNDDIGHTLDYGRKHGLHMTLAHQHLAQLSEENPKVYKSVMADARTKVVFGGLAPDDADILAQQIFTGWKDWHKVRDEIINPMVVGIREERRTVEGQGATSGSQTSHVDGQSTPSGNLAGAVTSSATGMVDSSGDSWSSTDVPVFIPQFEDRVSSRQLFGLQDLQEMDKAKIVNQPTQYAFVRIPDRDPVQIKVPTLRDGFASRETTEKFVEGSYRLMEGLALPIHEAEKQIEERHRALIKEASASVPLPDDEDF